MEQQKSSKSSKSSSSESERKKSAKEQKSSSRKEDVLTAKSEPLNTEHADEKNKRNRKNAILPISDLPEGVSPVGEISDKTYREVSKGVNTRDIDGNENFDLRFLTNQLAVRQHDPKKRDVPSLDIDENDDEKQEFNVIAKRVTKTVDVPCWITVSQHKHLGSGTFSDVYSGTVKMGNKYFSTARPSFAVAIKKIWPDRSREDLQISTHRVLDHKNIIKLLFYYVCVHPTTKKLMWTLILEQMPSTILHEHALYMDRKRFMKDVYIKLFIYQTLKGLAYMEEKKIMHRDIKPDNLLVNMDTGILKIGDFGSSKVYKETVINSPYQVTRYYRAPELCMKYKLYGPTVDVWAAGCILCELLINRRIFNGRNNDDQLLQIFSVCGTPTFEQVQKCAPGFKMGRRWTRTGFAPANWLSILRRYNSQITNVHADFVSKYIGFCLYFIFRILRYEREERLRGERAFAHEFFDTLRKPGCTLPNGNPLPDL